MLAQFRILCGYTNWTRVILTATHHNAPHNDKSCCGKTELLSAKHGSNNYIPCGFQLAICLHNNTTAQIVQNKSLVCFC